MQLKNTVKNKTENSLLRYTVIQKQYIVYLRLQLKEDRLLPQQLLLSPIS